MNLTPEKLISEARALVQKIDLGNGLNAGTIAAALESKSGNVYTGICVDLACGLGVCAEYSAVLEMLKHREKEIAQIVAVDADSVLSPCGRCRELMIQVSPSNATTSVVVSESESVLLADLLPRHWLDKG